MIRVLHMLPDVSLGGGQMLLLRNIVGMDRAQFEHIVCTTRPPPPPGNSMAGEYSKAGVEIVSLGIRSAAGVPRGLARLVRLVRSRGIDVIHTNNTGSDRLLGQSAALLCGRPLVNSLHSQLYLGKPAGLVHDVVRRIRLGVDRFLARRTVRRVVAVGVGVREAWMPYLRGLGIQEHHVAVIHPGIDLSRFGRNADARAALRASLGLDGAGPILMTIARFAPGKGHELLPALLRRVRTEYSRVRLVLVGDGERRETVASLIQREGLVDATVFTGRRDDVPELLEAADVVVFPSLSEGFPLSVLEAMAAGKPIVAFDLPSFAELGDGRSALALAPIGDEPALTSATLDVLGDPARMTAMSRSGRAVAERFGQDRASRALESVYREVIGDRK